MIELFSKQGVSVPITTTMVWEGYQHVKQGGEAAGIDGIGSIYTPTEAGYCTSCGYALHQEVILQKLLRRSAFPKGMGAKEC